MTCGYYQSDDVGTDFNIGYLIRRAAVLLTDRIEGAFSAHGLSFTQWLVLKILSNDQPLSLLELSGRIGFDPGTVSRAVDDLHGEGLVDRERSTQDRRAIVLTLTPQGRKFVHINSPIALGELNALLEDFTRAEADLLIGLLQRMLAKLVAGQETRRQSNTARARLRVS